MKKLIYLVFPILLLFACNTNEENTETTADTPNEVLTEFITLTFEGSLKAKKAIPVAMKLNKTGQNLSGQMLYKKVGEPIDLAGNINDASTISLQESIDGKVTGTYEGQIVDNIFVGIWKSGDGKTSFDFSMNVSDNDFSSFIKEKMKILQYTGLYEIKPAANQNADYHYKFEIEHTGGENIKYLFYGNRGKPSYNMGSLEGETAIKGNIAYVENKEGTCKFSLTFRENGTMDAVYVDEKNDCDFGFGIYLEGNYKKTNSDIPTFENPMR